jgi:hypothetical protein
MPLPTAFNINLQRERNKILKKRDGINAAGHYVYSVLRPMLVRILPVVKKVKIYYQLNIHEQEQNHGRTSHYF